ncbi:L-asparagine ABC transporter permease [Mycobacterium tuberculosis]|nr:L-asparagine ABC transporter permease [Mycobacterium tuberculosis]
MPPLDITDERLTREDTGYHKGLHSRQLQMIALGGAIGTGLFLGAGGRLASAGPGLFLVYGICGIFVFLILRALGELVLHRPSSGSFVSYAREFYGEKVAFVAGWMYFLNWAMTGIVDTTAIAHYCHYWRAFQPIPQWTLALIALLVVLSMNLISVRLFGELEFWASLIKVIALVTFLIVGTVFLAGRYKIDGQETGVSLWSSHGGIVPTGLLPIVLVTSGVVFAYAAIELVGIAAGETAEPAKIMPRAINSVVLRIACFYVGSTVLLALLLPYTAYKEHVSPFVTFFSKIGIDAAGSVMNLVVLTAALSSLNAGCIPPDGSCDQWRSTAAARGSPHQCRRPACRTAGSCSPPVSACWASFSTPSNRAKPSRSCSTSPRRESSRPGRRSWLASCGSTGWRTPGSCSGRNSGCRFHRSAAI